MSLGNGKCSKSGCWDTIPRTEVSWSHERLVHLPFGACLPRLSLFCIFLCVPMLSPLNYELSKSKSLAPHSCPESIALPMETLSQYLLFNCSGPWNLLLADLQCVESWCFIYAFMVLWWVCVCVCVYLCAHTWAMVPVEAGRQPARVILSCYFMGPKNRT